MMNAVISKRVHPYAGTVSMTKQSHKDECDINQILAKFQKSGMVTHSNKNAARYGFATSLDLRESLEIVKEAQTMFDELPSTIRKKFRNEPAEFLDFVQNPDNLAEMGEMGMLNPPLAVTTVRLEALPVKTEATPHAPVPNKP